MPSKPALQIQDIKNDYNSGRGRSNQPSTYKDGQQPNNGNQQNNKNNQQGNGNDQQQNQNKENEQSEYSETSK
ncbi:hypothetical protein ACX0G9_00235 [Flavitalea flava]